MSRLHTSMTRMAKPYLKHDEGVVTVDQKIGRLGNIYASKYVPNRMIYLYTTMM